MKDKQFEKLMKKTMDKAAKPKAKDRPTYDPTLEATRRPEAGNQMMDAMQPIIDGIKGVLTGPPVWSYRAAGPGKVVLRAGFQVKPGTRGRAPYASRLEPAWSCLSALYQGPMPEIIAAWEELFDFIEAAMLRGAASVRQESVPLQKCSRS